MKRFFFTLVILGVAFQGHAQEQAEVMPESTLEDQVPAPAMKDYKAEMNQLFKTYSLEKEQLEKEYTQRIEAMKPELSDVQGMIDKQNTISEFKSKKKALLKTYRENNHQLKLEEKAFRESRVSQETDDEEEYDEEYYEEEPVPAPVKKSVSEVKDDRKKRAITPYEETKGYRKKPKAKAKKKSSYVLKDNKPKVKRQSNIKKGLLNKNSNKHDND